MKTCDHYSLKTLEFGKALGLFERYLRTPISVPLLRASQPTEDLDWLDTRFREIAQAAQLLETGKTFWFEGISDIHPVLRQAAVPGAVCEGSDLYRVLETARGFRLLRKSLRDIESPLGPLDTYLHRLVPQEDLEKRLGACLEPDGTLKDAASPSLNKLRAQIRRQRGHIQKRLEEMCRRPEIRKSLQEDYFTERGGRHVLPVQSTLKRNVRGIQHGRSDTGTTAYIEPLELVEAGNLLVESIEEEGRETLRIFKELTLQVGESSGTTQANLDTVALLDLVVSLADYLLDVRGCLPEIVSEGGLELRQVRHPLLLAKLPAAEVVANDLVLPANRSGVIITGPNTGGKTVVLKTAGLLCLMALSGLPIPCGPGTRIPVMGGVLADIGDEQSIEQSLSTFSSHISQMTSFVEVSREIRERHAPRPLIVLDELGAGTDPAEGSALGRAFIEELMNLGAWVLVATHLGDLKLFGHSHPSLSSGSMRFDSETLSPTYEFLMDTVGESHGLEIASRLGLPGSIVERANELIESDPNQAASLLHRLTEEERAARELREQIERIKSDIEEKQGILVRRIEQTARREKDILDTARKEAEHKIASAKKRVSHIEDHIAKEEKKLKKGYDGKERDLEEREKEIAWMERDLEKRMKLLLDLAAKFPNFAPDPLRNLDTDRYRSMRLDEPEWKRILREINQEEKILASEFPVPQTIVRVEDDVRPDWESIRPGDTIRVEGLDRSVTVAKKDEKKKRLVILIGNLSSEISWDRVLQRTGREAPAQPENTGGSGMTRFVAPDIGLELNLIGLTVEEMEPKLMKYLDDAVLSGLGEVRIIHGFGMGVLRAAVEKILLEHPNVRESRRGGAAEGGGGATVATLKM